MKTEVSLDQNPVEYQIEHLCAPLNPYHFRILWNYSYYLLCSIRILYARTEQISTSLWSGTKTKSVFHLFYKHKSKELGVRLNSGFRVKTL